MKLKNYQETHIQELVGSMLKQIDMQGMRRKIVFQAPTGSGKTVMTTEAMCRLHETIGESDCQYSRVAYVWIAPNELHKQTYKSMKHAFSDTRRLRPVVYEELDLGYDGYLQPGEVLFVNWQSINKEKNIMVRGSEQTSTVYDIIDRTRRQRNTAIVCIIDEEHLFAGTNAKKSEKVLARINPKVELRVSATPQTLTPDGLVKIDRQLVINEGMIKQGIQLNPAVHNTASADALNIILLGEAIKRRNQLAKAYEKLGVNINPLLLIQLPNDDSEKMSQDEIDLKDNLLSSLDNTYNESIQNGKVAVWLSGEKQNLESIEQKDSLVNVLIFKQAIAMGWDCPRAAVLLIYRKLSSQSFTTQTVGRIMRMPEQRFYIDPLLNMGYVYTDLSSDVIKIEADAVDYINTLRSKQRDGLKGVSLRSYKEERSNKENNVLRSDFKNILLQHITTEWGLPYRPGVDESIGAEQIAENRRRAGMHIRLDVESVQVEIPTDMNIVDEEGTIMVENRTGFARTGYELQAVFGKFCSRMLSGWSKVQSISILQGGLLDAMYELLEVSEHEAYKIICSHENQPKFADIITRALDYYKTVVLQKKRKADRGFVAVSWTLPEERSYKDSTYREREDVKNHALMPYCELNKASTPEQRFTAFLEAHSDSIDWWYKNGDNGSEHFAVLYENSQGKKALFYVDFIVRMKTGKIYLFDTKSENSDPEAPYKHNALIDYMADAINADKDIEGGIIIESQMNWRYCRDKITDTTDLRNWETFMLN